MKNKFLSAVILSGGKSSRMGFDKQLLSPMGKRIIEKNITFLKQLFNEVIIVTEKPEYYENLDVRISTDLYTGMGPLAGIHSGLIASSQESDYVYFVACDMPHLNKDYIEYMKSILRYSSYDACVSRVNDHVEPFNSFYSRKLICPINSDLANCNTSLFYMLRDANTYYIPEEKVREFSPDLKMYLNLNTRQDLLDYILQQ